jgi:hypothetical protein
MSIFNFDNKKNRKISPIQRMGIEFYYKERQIRELCQMCGNEIPGGDYLQQLWVEDLPLARVCTDCVAMIQRLLIEVRKERLEIKRISES